MTQHLFISNKSRLLDNWSNIANDACIINNVKDIAELEADTTIWMEWEGIPSETDEQALRIAVETGRRVVVMSVKPSDEHAKLALSNGAHGYCHTLASTKQLQEISVSVNHGGLWVGPSVLQSLLRQTVSNQAAMGGAIPSDQDLSSLDTLSRREREVASKVAECLTNFEIAQHLHISERTVKAHLTKVFKKLKTRDRVQLALYLNNQKNT